MERKQMCLHHWFLKMKDEQSLTVPGWSSSKLAQILCGSPKSKPSFRFLWIFSGGTVSSLSKWLKNKTYANIYDLTFTAFIIIMRIIRFLIKYIRRVVHRTSSLMSCKLNSSFIFYSWDSRNWVIKFYCTLIIKTITQINSDGLWLIQNTNLLEFTWRT